MFCVIPDKLDKVLVSPLERPTTCSQTGPFFHPNSSHQPITTQKERQVKMSLSTVKAKVKLNSS